MRIYAEPLIIAAAFLCFWLINMFRSGWYSLAKRFRVDELPEGEWI